MDNLRYCFTLFYFSYILTGVTCDHCSETYINRCWEPIDSYLRTEGEDPDHKDFALFHLNTEQLNLYCALYKNSTSNCLTDIRYHCSFDQTKVFKGLEDALDFFCNNGFDDYIQYKDCIGSENTQSGIHSCTDQFQHDYDSLLYSSSSYSELEDKFCEAVYDSIDCDKDIVSDLCGEVAAEWVETYEMALYNPYMEQYDCHRKNITGTIVGVIIGVVALLIIACCIVACFVHHKKQKQLCSRRYTANQTMAFYNNGMVGNGQPQVGFAAAANHNEKGAGVPPDMPVQTPPYPGVFIQPSPPPPYSKPSQTIDNSNTMETSQTSQQEQGIAVPPPPYGSELTASGPQYLTLN